MARLLNVGIAGATGAVGVEFLDLLDRRSFPVGDLRLFGSKRSAGSVVTWKGRAITVEELASADPKGLDLGLFSAGKEISKVEAPRFAEAGVLVIDNSSCFRKDPAIPLVVPELNADVLAESPARIVANPNCSTIILLVALGPLHRALGVSECVVSSYQAVSGAGRSALDEMFAQARAHAAGQPEIFRFYDRPIHLNVIPKIGGWLPNGDTEEDAKFTTESQKILGDSRFKVWATTVRVPVERCHSESVWVRFERPTSVEEVTRMLEAAPGVKLADLATPRELARHEDVYVSRIRVDEDDPRVVRFWVVGDQLWKGAALNAIQIAEELIRLGRFEG